MLIIVNELLRFAHEFENCGRMTAVLEKEELAREALLNKMGQFMFSKLLPLHVWVNFVFVQICFWLKSPQVVLWPINQQMQPHHVAQMQKQARENEHML